jgi:hypothetical protein
MKFGLIFLGNNLNEICDFYNIFKSNLNENWDFTNISKK